MLDQARPDRVEQWPKVYLPEYSRSAGHISTALHTQSAIENANNGFQPVMVMQRILIQFRGRRRKSTERKMRI